MLLSNVIRVLVVNDPEALAKTGLGFDAVLGEMEAVVGCQPRLIVGDF